MSHCDDRDSNHRRHRPKLDRESGPKRSRRDDKPDTDRVSRNPILDTDRDQKHHRQLRDSSPLDAPLAHDSKVESAAVSKESLDNKTNGHDASHKNITDRKEFDRKDHNCLDPSGVPRSNTYFQHDERDSARRVGQSYSGRTTNERGWRRDSKDQHDDRLMIRRETRSGTRERDDRSHARRNDNNVWRHDGFYQLEAAPPPPPRKRPAFSEKKNLTETESAEKTANETGKHDGPDQPMLSEVREESFGGEGDNGHHLNRPERPLPRDGRPSYREDPPRRGNSRREGYGGRREQFGARQGYNQAGGQADKWKHDLYDEANKSPTRKNEDDQIATVEALLSL